MTFMTLILTLRFFSFQDNEFRYLYPDDEMNYPGIGKRREILKEWEWIFGKTPEFNIKRTFCKVIDGEKLTLDINLTIHNGILKTVELNPSDEQSLVKIDTGLIKNELVGKRFHRDTIMESVFYNGAKNGQMVTSQVFKWIGDAFLEMIP